MHRLLITLTASIVLASLAPATYAQEPPVQPSVQAPPATMQFPPGTVFPVEIPPLPPPAPPPKFWCFGAELGLNGTSGNSENFKMRAAFNAKNDTPDHLWTFDAWYSYATANGLESENQGQVLSRYEWKWGTSPWSWFVSGELNQNQFTAYDYRLAAHTGVVYTCIKNEWTLLKGRLGAGGSREFNGPNDDFLPEALLGADFEQKFSKRCKLCLSGDVYPDLADFGEYRAELRASVEMLVDPELNLSLKAGALDRYDSTPEGRKPNDVEYYLALLWKY